MKYNPKIAESGRAAARASARLHPLQPDRHGRRARSSSCGASSAPCARSPGWPGPRCNRPPAPAASSRACSSCGPTTAERGDPRGTVAIPDSSHGTNPASVRLAGYEALQIPSDARGLVDVSALEKLIDEDVAGLMLTNPNTLGLFEEEIERITEVVHRIGGLVYYDGANLNAILGPLPAGRHGVRHRPHQHAQDVRDAARWGRAGRRTGRRDRASSCRSCRCRASSATRTARSASTATRRDSIGRMHGFLGNFGVLVRAYAYVFLHGRDGLQGGRRARRAERELPRRAREGRVPAGVPGRPPDARVRGHARARSRRRRASGRWTSPSA